MPLADYVLTIALGGAFALGLMFIVMRREAQVNLQSGMSAEGLLQQHSGMGFGKAKKNLDRKLATIQDLLRQQNQGDRQLAEERFNQRRQEQLASEEAARRQREIDEAQRQSELEAARQRQEEEARAEPPSETLRRHALPPSKKPSAKPNSPRLSRNAKQKLRLQGNKRCSNPVRLLSEPCPNCVHALSAKVRNRPTFRFR